jgi:hypothetical protein
MAEHFLQSSSFRNSIPLSPPIIATLPLLTSSLLLLFLVCGRKQIMVIFQSIEIILMAFSDRVR